MWTAFTRPVLLGLLLGALLGGCASGGGPAGSGAEAAGAVERQSAAARSTNPAAGQPAGRPLPPAPAVTGDNAVLFDRATELLLAGRHREAETLLLELTRDQPELAGPWINLAQVYRAQNRDDDAVAALEQAVLANPGNCDARTELGVLLRRRGEFGAAETHYLTCLEYRPDYQAAYLNLGILYDLYLGRLDDALAAYRRYQSLAAEPDRRVDVWVVDLERRLGS